MLPGLLSRRCKKLKSAQHSAVNQFESNIPSISMKIINININALGRIPPHICKTLGRQTIRARSIRANIPLDTGIVDPVTRRNAIQPTAKRHTSRSRRPERVIVGLVDGRVVVEVLLHVDEVVAILREVAADLPGVFGLVAWDVVALKD